jgi:hypothetical protein
VHRPPKKQSPSKQTGWIARIPKIWQAVIFVLGIPGLYVGILSILPRVSVTPGDLLHSGQPLSFPMVVSNDGVLYIHDAKISCIIDSVVDENHATMIGGGTDTNTFQLGDIGPGGRATTFCLPNLIGFSRPLAEGHIVASLYFRPDFLPWRTVRHFQFRGTAGDNHSFHWVQTSN